LRSRPNAEYQKTLQDLSPYGKSSKKNEKSTAGEFQGSGRDKPRLARLLKNKVSERLVAF
jgi:hypothetical protein